MTHRSSANRQHNQHNLNKHRRIRTTHNHPTCPESFISPKEGAKFTFPARTHTLSPYTPQKHRPPTDRRPPANRPRADAHEPLVGACRSTAPAVLPSRAPERSAQTHLKRSAHAGLRHLSVTHMRRGAAQIGCRSRHPCPLGNPRETIRPLQGASGLDAVGGMSWAVQARLRLLSCGSLVRRLEVFEFWRLGIDSARTFDEAHRLGYRLCAGIEGHWNSE
ncbi:hypothetical protein C8Q73DRAFT_131824 [Cubamyces lactineus]|nr:hypothetical protein C8Q73DRAFT_131824 [Cubamyces lactineus]